LFFVAASSSPATDAHWLFKKKRDINQLIFDCAEHRNAEDERELVALVMEAELFAPVIIGARNVPDETRYVVGPHDVIGLGTARLGELNMTLFYTPIPTIRVVGAPTSR
jgi:hypothetical protein